jgi:hypothetical protein
MKFVESIYGLIFAALWAIGIFEILVGWQTYIPFLYRLRPTIYRTSRLYGIGSEKFLETDFGNMDEITVIISRPSKMILFRRKLFFRFEAGSSWPLFGTIELTDLGDKCKAEFVGKPPFGTTYLVAFFCFVPGCFSTHDSSRLEVILSFLGTTVFVAIMLGASYFLEKGRFVRHIADIENVLRNHGIIPESENSTKSRAGR